MKKIKLLIVDDEPALRKTLSDRLTVLYGVTPDSCSNGADAVAKVRENDYDVVVLDIEMPGMDGMEVLKQIREIKPKTQVIMFTGHGSEDRRILSETLGAFNYVDKIDGLAKLAPMIEGAYKLR
ncbi:response regulator, partial [Desulfococcaceae bacterium OttesenSCG-928-F15]|nr:response regulator [Desulfococcaceae bacterium OttesenSCG-928-F15]